MAKDNTKKESRNTVPNEPYKDEEFEKFLDILEDPTVQAHWYEIAEALGIVKDTITRWSKHPKAIEARQRGLKEALKGMKTSGQRDWRMWSDKVKMLGINPVTKTDITSKGEKITVFTQKTDDELKQIVEGGAGTSSRSGTGTPETPGS